MSNLGLKEIKIPSNLKLTLNSNVLKIEGIFGKTEYTLDSRFILKMVVGEGGKLKLIINN